MIKPIIRAARLEDCTRMAGVQVDSYRSAYRGLFPATYLEGLSYTGRAAGWRAQMAAHPEDIRLVAIVMQQVVGYVLARSQPEIYPGYDSEVIAIHVRSEHQHRGVGTALLAQAVGALASRGCGSVMLWALKDNPTRGWYEKLGGHLIGEQSFQVDGWEVYEVAYGWGRIDRMLENLGAHIQET